MGRDATQEIKLLRAPSNSSIQLLCLQRDWGCVMDWSSAEDSLMTEAEPSWEFLFCSNVDSMLPAEVLKTLCVLIYKLILVTDPAEIAVNPWPILRQPVMVFWALLFFFSARKTIEATQFRCKQTLNMLYVKYQGVLIQYTSPPFRFTANTLSQPRDLWKTIYSIFGECHPGNYPIALAPQCWG